MADIEERLRNRWRNPNIPDMPAYMRPSPAQFEKKINDYITLKFEHNRTIIYVAGRRIIQCVHLIINIPKNDVPKYDEIDSIDEAADVYRKQGGFFGHFGAHSGGISPEQEFWGHCSNIQAWVEHDYDTRILMSNLSFPLLRELSRAGDPVAKRVYREEIALRLESGYPSVVQYLLSQGYIGVFTPSEFESILEASDIIKNLSSFPGILNQFVRSCSFRFPTLMENIILKILKLREGKKHLISIIQKRPAQAKAPFTVRMRYLDPRFIQLLDSTLKTLLKKVHEDSMKNVISECIQMIKNTYEEISSYRESILRSEFRDGFIGVAREGRENRDLFRARAMDNLRELAELRAGFERRTRVQRHQARCTFCGRTIPRGQEFCEWCGHRRDDDDDFFPFPFIFRDPGGGSGGGGSMKGEIAIPIKVRT
jgi:hypothetical protein